MQRSFYAEYTDKFFGQLILSIVEKLNEKRENGLSYMFRSMLTPTFSADGTWQSILADYSRVAADVVALDSELPVKTRDSIEVAHGNLPKMGMKLFLTEKQMDDIDTMIAKGLPLNQIVATMFADAPRCIDGIYERIEDTFLSELSTGIGLSERNVGTGVRIDVGYKDENQFKAKEKTWKDSSSGKYDETVNILDDIEQVFDKALEDANVITNVYADDYALRAMYRNLQVRQQYAFNQDFVGDKIPALDFEKVRNIFSTKWGVDLARVSRKIKTELNGERKNHSPWAEGRIVFTCSQNVGNLVYGSLQEASRPVAGVTYQTADDFILVSRYSKNDPLREYTSSQAKVIPVIQNVDQIYTLDPTKTVG